MIHSVAYEQNAINMKYASFHAQRAERTTTIIMSEPARFFRVRFVQWSQTHSCKNTQSVIKV